MAPKIGHYALDGLPPILNRRTNLINAALETIEQMAAKSEAETIQ